MSSPELPAGSGLVAARYEARWSLAMGAIIFLLLATIVFTGVHFASMPPSRVETIDPTTLDLQGEFVETNLGTRVDPAGRITVHVLAEQYAFRPACLVVPDGESVTFRVTSADVIHGLEIMGTNVNSMLVPGYVSTFVATIHGAGEHALPCHEFCGVGHAAMWARVEAVPPLEFARLTRSNPRPDCAALTSLRDVRGPT
jgi:cytochrome c oxidase subunit II